MPRIQKYIYMHNIAAACLRLKSKKESILWHEFDCVCGKLQTTMIRRAAVGISSCTIINIVHYQETNSHDVSRSTTKLTKWHMRPAKKQISLGIRQVWSESSLSSKETLSKKRRLWSDWADAQPDLSLRWARMSFCGFCHLAAQMTSLFRFLKVWGRRLKKLVCLKL